MGEEQKKVLERKIKQIKKSRLSKKEKQKLTKNLKKTGSALSPKENKEAEAAKVKSLMKSDAKRTAKGISSVSEEYIPGYRDLKNAVTGTVHTAKTAYKAGSAVGKALSSRAGMVALGRTAVSMIPGANVVSLIATGIDSVVNASLKAEDKLKTKVANARVTAKKVAEKGSDIASGAKDATVKAGKKIGEDAPKLLTTEGAKEIKEEIKDSAKKAAKSGIEKAKDAASSKLDDIKEGISEKTDPLTKPFKELSYFKAQMNEAKLKDEGILSKDFTMFPEKESDEDIRKKILEMEQKKRLDSDYWQEEDKEQLEDLKQENNNIILREEERERQERLQKLEEERKASEQAKVDAFLEKSQELADQAEKEWNEKKEKERKSKLRASRIKKIVSFNSTFTGFTNRFINAMVGNAGQILDQQSQVGKDEDSQKGVKKAVRVAKRNKFQIGDKSDGLVTNLRRLRKDLSFKLKEIKRTAQQKDNNNEDSRKIMHLRRLKQDMNALMHDQNLMSTLGIGEDSAYYDSDQGASGEPMFTGLVDYENKIISFLEAGQDNAERDVDKENATANATEAATNVAKDVGKPTKNVEQFKPDKYIL